MTQSKDINRFSYSRIATFKRCPRKHHYIYVEQIETKPTAPMIAGKLFHQCIEATLAKQDCQPIYDEFKKLCQDGTLDFDYDLLEYIVTEYFRYYASEYAEEQTLLVEKEFTDKLDKNAKLDMIIDQAFRYQGLLYLRDIKTTGNSLKYEPDDVRFNQQLLLYIPYVENYLNEKVSAIQIDEVRLAKLQPVPIKNNGKPSTDKRLLSFVTYEAYYDVLCQMNLENEPEYKAIQDYLAERGHPLFNRVTVQMLDDQIVVDNAQDFLDAVKACKKDPSYRVPQPLCNYCEYKELCTLDHFSIDSDSRQAIIDKLK